MTNFKVTVRADCAVSACSSLPLSIKALAPWLSVGAVGLWTGVPPPPVASLWNKTNFPSQQLCLFIGFRAASSRTPTFGYSFLAPNVGLLCSSDIWILGFSEKSCSHDKALGWLWGDCCLLALRGDFGETFLAVAETICFGDPPCSSPARHWLPTDAFPWWNRKMLLDELMSSRTK